MRFENIYTCNATREHNNNDWLKTIRGKKDKVKLRFGQILMLIWVFSTCWSSMFFLLHCLSEISPFFMTKQEILVLCFHYSADIFLVFQVFCIGRTISMQGCLIAKHSLTPAGWIHVAHAQRMNKLWKILFENVEIMKMMVKRTTDSIKVICKVVRLGGGQFRQNRPTNA